MRSAGIDVRPLREITGEALFNEVFLDDVFVPDDCLVGELGDGWKLARTTLANERVAMATTRLSKSTERAVDAGRRSWRSPRRSGSRVGRAVALSTVCTLLGVRTTLRSLAGQGPGAESSVAKLLGVRNRQDGAELVVELQGDGLLAPSERLRKDVWELLNTRCLSIAGGTTQILRNVAGERILGLPAQASDARAGPHALGRTPTLGLASGRCAPGVPGRARFTGLRVRRGATDGGAGSASCAAPRQPELRTGASAPLTTH